MTNARKALRAGILEGSEKLNYLTGRLGDEIAQLRGKRPSFAPHWAAPDRVAHALKRDVPLWVIDSLEKLPGSAPSATRQRNSNRTGESEKLAELPAPNASATSSTALSLKGSSLIRMPTPPERRAEASVSHKAHTFQDQTALAIIEAVFKDYPQAHYRIEIAQTLRTRSLCTRTARATSASSSA